ncbi:MAG: thioredoxin [Rhizobiaceae bacterium]
MNDRNNPFAQQGGYGAVEFGDRPVQPAAPRNDLIKDTTTAGFAGDVLQESRRQPVLVDFWAPWCGPCKQLTPALEHAVRGANGAVKLVKMNIDDHPSIAGQLGIQSIPAVIAFKNGQPVDGFMGAVPESQINEFIRRVAGPGEAENGIAEALAAAAEALTAGDAGAAEEIYAALVDQAPDNVEAVAGLAGLLADRGEADEAESVIARAPEAVRAAPSIAAIQTRLALAREAAKLGDPVALERRLAASAKDHDAAFDLAMIRNVEGRRTDAADLLLGIIRADRAWREDGARSQLVKFFEAWGPTDEATLAARRKLSSLLFS